MIKKPKKLARDNQIITVSTSNWVTPEIIQMTADRFAQHGWTLHTHSNCHLRFNQQAGTHQQRAQALQDAFADSKFDAVWITAGGDRALHTLDHIDFDAIGKNPKIIIGYSDTTALLIALYHKCNMMTFHGPDIARLSGSKLSPQTIAQSFSLLKGNDNSIELSGSKILKNKQIPYVDGITIGGNLTLIHNLIGTEYMPDLSGHILFIEDELEPLWNIDRMLLRLKRAKGFNNIKAIIAGNFKDCRDKTNAENISFAHSVEDLLLEHTSGLDIPVITDAPFGHMADLITIPIGAKARINLAPVPHIKFQDTLFIDQ